MTPADMLLKIVKVPGLALLATIGFLSVSLLVFFVVVSTRLLFLFRSHHVFLPCPLFSLFSFD